MAQGIDIRLMFDAWQVIVGTPSRSSMAGATTRLATLSDPDARNASVPSVRVAVNSR